MKTFSLFLILSILFFSCQENTKSLDDDTKNIPGEVHQELYGAWVGQLWWGTEGAYEGMMDGDVIDKVNLTIKRITKDSVFAQATAAGKIKPLLGKMTDSSGTISFILKELGTDKSDGIYQFKLKKDTLIGTWKPFKESEGVFEKEYKLLKKQPIYDAKLMIPTEETGYVDWRTFIKKQIKDTSNNGENSYEQYIYRISSRQIFLLNASTTVLNENDLKNLRKIDLEIIRNTIFARHGYAFKNIKFRQFFDPIDWYVPLKENIDGELSPLEKTNISLLTRMEKYATDSYEIFGR